MRFNALKLAALIALSIQPISGFADFKQTLKVCADCHGQSGNTEKHSMPSIAGISEIYFTDSMAAFKENERPSSTITRPDKPDTSMHEIAKQLSEPQLAQLAQYFSQQTFTPIAQKFDPVKAKSGKRLHKKYCGKCHEKGGSSSEDDAGILAGQHKDYLRKALNEIISGDRVVGRKMKKRLQKVIKKEGDEGIENLIQFYISRGN